MRLTARMAGSSGTRGGGGGGGAGSQTWRSFTSEPLNTIYSKILSEGGISKSGSPLRPSVPKERTIILNIYILVSVSYSVSYSTLTTFVPCFPWNKSNKHNKKKPTKLTKL